MGKEIFELIAPCHFGMEAVLKREINDLGYEISKVENGKVTFLADAEGICRGNIFLRTTERILLKVAEFKAETFDELFEACKAIPWERYIPENGKFWVTKATSVNSKLFSPSDIQRIVKKVTETLAAAMLLLSPWKKDRILVDPFCGSGTIPIEAAMIACRIAPGLNREFLSEEWDNLIPKKEWYGVVEEAQDMVCEDAEVQIQGYDIDDEVLKMARANAALAGVEDKIHFQRRDIINFSSPKKYGFVVSNPPYGERLSDKKQMEMLYRSIGQIIKENDTWSFFLLSGYEEAQKMIGKKADKNRKIYNGMMKTYLYQYMGIKPPRRPAKDQ